MLEELSLNGVIEIIQEHESLINTNISKYLERLLKNDNPDKNFSTVYSILHIICTKDLYINTIPNHEYFIERLHTVIKCLEYLINHWTPECQYPDNGIEKILYTLINHQQSKLYFMELEELLILSFKFGQKSPDSSSSILQAGRQKVTCLKLNDINCTCHKNETADETNCSNIGLVRCYLVTSAFKYISEEIDIGSYVTYLCRLLDMIMKSEHCLCHCEKLYTAILYALDFFILEVKVPNDKINFLIWPKNFIANCFAFSLCLNKLSNASEDSECSSDYHLNVKSIEDTTESLEMKLFELESLFKKEECEKSEISALKKIYIKGIFDLLKDLNSNIPKRLPIQWASFLPPWFNLCLQGLNMSEHKSVTVMFFKAYLLMSYEVVKICTDSEIYILVFKQFYQLLNEQSSYIEGIFKFIYGLVINFGIAVERKDFNLEEAEEYLSILLLIYPTFINPEFKEDRNVLWLTRLTIRLLESVGRSNDAMKYAARSIVRFNTQPNLRKMVNYWIQILIREMRKKEDYFKFIDVDMPPDCDRAIIERALLCQLDICKHSAENPPRCYYKVLMYLLDYDESPENHLTYTAILSVLLHVMNGYFDHDRSPLELSTQVYESLETTKLKCEVEIIALYSHYICKWEVLLKDVCQSRKDFREKSSKSKQNHPNFIEWFPNVGTLDRSIISRVVQLCDDKLLSKNGQFDFYSELIQALSVVRVILNLQGNMMSSLKLLLFQEKVLQEFVKLEHAPMKYNVCLVCIKCQISKILCGFNKYDEALKYAEGGNELYEELLQTKFQENQNSKELAYMRLESKIALTRAYIYTKKISLAIKLMSELKSDDLITGKRTYESCLYTTRMNSVAAELYVARSMEDGCVMKGEEHPVEIAKDNYSTLMATLEKACKGSCQAVVSVNHGNMDIPTFGNLSKQCYIDIVRLFEMLEELFSSLQNLVEKYLSLGSVKLATSVILDGILLSRFYLIPERELQFQVFYARCKLTAGENEFLQDQLIICDDVIHFIEKLEKGETKPTRCRLFSATEADKEKKDKSDLKDAINNSSIMEDAGCDNITKCDDDDDVIIVESQPLNVKANAVFDKKVLASPALSPNRKNVLSKGTFAFVHNDGCLCHICSNVLMTKLQSGLAEIHGFNIAKTGSVTAAVNCVKAAINVLDIRSLNSKQALVKILDLNNSRTSGLVFLGEKMKSTATLSSIYLSAGLNKPAAIFAVYGLTKLKGQPNAVPLLKAQARFHFVLGQCMMSPEPSTKLDQSKYLSLVVDSLSNPKNASRKNVPNNIFRKRNPTVTFKEDKTDLIQPLQTLKVDSDNIKLDSEVFFSPAKVPIAKKKDKENFTSFQTPVKTPHTKIKTSTATKTPKNARSSKLRTPATKKKKKPSEFTIFNDDDVPEISIKKPTAVKKLPVPDIPSTPPDPESLSHSFKSMSLTSTARKKKKATSRRVVLSSSSGEEDDGVWYPDIKEETPTPIAASRRPRRKAAETSLQNIKAMRRNARKNYLEEEGLNYKEAEEPEVGRPVKKNSRRKAINNLANDTIEMECDREIVRSEKTSHALPEVNTDISTPSDGIVESDDNMNCVEHLLTCFDMATAASDTYLIKTSLQLLSVEQNKINKKEKLKNCKPSFYHLLSIGCTLRLTIHNFTKTKIQRIETNKVSCSAAMSESDRNNYMSALEDLHYHTSPCYMKSLMRDTHDISIFDDVSSRLPGDWSVCVMSVLEQGPKPKFFLTRLRNGEDPFQIQLNDCFTSEEFAKFNELFQLNMQTLKTKDILQWWQQRIKTEKIMKSYIVDMEKKILGIHRGILLGSLCGKKSNKLLTDSVKEIQDVIQSMEMRVDKRLIEIYLSVWSTFSSEEKTSAILNLYDINGIIPTGDRVVKLAVLFESKSITDLYKEPRNHVILILGKGLQNLPWESISTLYSHPVSRMPSLDMLRWHLQLLALRKNLHVDLRNSVYILNPGGDLGKTEARFSDWFKSISAWEGMAGEAPTPSQWLSYLQNKDAFFYLGHGAGNVYVRTDKLAVQQTNSCVFLMGCSSAKLYDSGICDPEGTINYYLLSGAPCVVGCLWVVTDKDIDKYFSHLISSWMKSGSNLVEHVRGSTKVLRMTYLNGAACVAYGLPVQSRSTVEEFYKNMPEDYKNLK